MKKKILGFLVCMLLIATAFSTIKEARNINIEAKEYDNLEGNSSSGGNQALDLVVANQGSDSVSVLLGDGTGSFISHTTYSVGYGPFGIVAGDFDVDGILDLVVTNIGDKYVSVILGDGTGGFRGHKDYLVGNGPRGVVTEDFNKDGYLDLAVTNHDDHDVSVLLGDGMGGFMPHGNFPVGSNPQDIATGDFDMDGNLDLAVVSAFYNVVSVLLGDGMGGFIPHGNFPVGSNPQDIATGDFDMDGNLDLAVTDYNDNDISVLLGDGMGGFGPQAIYPVKFCPLDIVTEDFNKDGNLDLAVTSWGENVICVLLGDGAGGFMPQTIYPVKDGPIDIVAEDFNKDGNLDLAVTSRGENVICVLLGDGAGAFMPQTTYSVGNEPRGIVTGDFNAGGKEEKYAILVAPVRKDSEAEYKHNIHETRLILKANGWSDDNIIFLTRRDMAKQAFSEWWIDGDATQWNVGKALDAIALGGTYQFKQTDGTLGPDQTFKASTIRDIVFIEFRDHGGIVYDGWRPPGLLPDPRPNDEADSFDGAFATYEREWNGVEWIRGFNSDYFWYDDEFDIKLDNIACKRLILEVDTCHSGEFIPDCSEPGRLIITSSREDESSARWAYLFYLRITNISADGYGGGAVDGRISVEEAHYFAVSQVRIQSPQIDDQIQGEVFLGPWTPLKGEPTGGKTRLDPNANCLVPLSTISYKTSSENVNHIVINELYYDCENLQSPLQWVELFNPAENSVDISGWIIAFDLIDGVNIFPTDIVIPANGYLIVTRDLDAFYQSFEIPEDIIVLDDDDMGGNLAALCVDSLRVFQGTIVIDGVDYGGGPGRAPAVRPPYSIARFKDAYDTDHSEVDWYIEKNPTPGSENHKDESSPPDKPITPSGPTQGRAGIPYAYSTSTTDPDGHQVYYLFAWGDGTTSEWMGPYNPSETIDASHAWQSKKTYEIRVKAKDTSGAESPWSEPLSVSIPKTKPYINTPFLNFLQNHPHMFPLSQYLLQKFLKL